MAWRRLRRSPRLPGDRAGGRAPRRAAAQRDAGPLRTRGPPQSSCGHQRARAGGGGEPAARGVRGAADDRAVPGRPAGRCAGDVPGVAATPRRGARSRPRPGGQGVGGADPSPRADRGRAGRRRVAGAPATPGHGAVARAVRCGRVDHRFDAGSRGGADGRRSCSAGGAGADPAPRRSGPRGGGRRSHGMLRLPGPRTLGRDGGQGRSRDPRPR